MDEKIIEQTYSMGAGGKKRTTTVRVGEVYRVEPLSAQRKRNRGRLFRVESFRQFQGHLVPSGVWLDTRERGWYTDPVEFVLVKGDRDNGGN